MHDRKLLVNADILPKVFRNHPSVYCTVTQTNISVGSRRLMMHATDSTITSPCAQVCGLQHSLPILHRETDQNNLHRASHLLLFSSPPWWRTCILSVQKLLRDISYKQHKLYSTENDNAAAALRTAITSSLDWGGFCLNEDVLFSD